MTDSCLNSCTFAQTDLRNFKCANYPDLLGHTSDINCIAFSPDGKYLASGSWDNTIKLWSVAEQKEVCTLRGHSGWIIFIEFSPDSKYLASGSNDLTFKMWDVDLQAEIAAKQWKTWYVTSIAFLSDGNFLVSGSNLGKV